MSHMEEGDASAMRKRSAEKIAGLFYDHLYSRYIHTNKNNSSNKKLKYRQSVSRLDVILWKGAILSIPFYICPNAIDTNPNVPHSIYSYNLAAY